MGNSDIMMLVGIVVLLLITGATCWAIITKMSHGVEVRLNGWTMTKSDIFDGDMRDFVVLAQRFALNHEYNLTGYNCVNYTNDLARIMDELGFSYQKVVGCEDGDGNTSKCHEWLRLMVDFEPQTGKFTDYSSEYPDQYVRQDE